MAAVPKGCRRSLAGRVRRGYVRAAAAAFACGLLAGFTTISFGSRARAGPRPATAIGRLSRSRINHRSIAIPRLVFGIYPGGAAGTVGPSRPPKPEDPRLRQAALEQLRPPRRPFVVRLYASYTAKTASTAREQVGQQIRAYAKAGFQTELVLCYRPAGGGSVVDVAGFADFARRSVQSFGPMPGFVSLQVTNEANVAGSPNTSDGYYAHAEDALIEGVISARREIRRDGWGQVKVGFNWAYATDGAESRFWHYLRRHGGRRFRGAIDWVGLDAYPGTWGPQLGSGAFAAATARFMSRALDRLRFTYLPAAGIPGRVSLRVSETGYATGLGRSQAKQIATMKAGLTAVYRARRALNITGYRWFDLRDADSSRSSFESHYGLMRDDYSPKPAFGVFRDLVAKLSS